MTFTLITPAATEPLTLAEARAHLVSDGSLGDDTYLESLITAARQHVESILGRQLVTATWDYKCDAFPCGAASLKLMKVPVASVTSVTYVDTAGVSQVWSASEYQTDLTSEPAVILPAYGYTWPSTRPQLNAVTVRFVAGYGAAAAVPAGLKHMMKLLLSHWYENREPVNLGNSVNALPLGFDALYWQHHTGEML